MCFMFVNNLSVCLHEHVRTCAWVKERAEREFSVSVTLFVFFYV